MLGANKDDMTLDEIAQQDQENLKGYKKGQKHKNLLLWIQKLESMQTILASEEQWGEMMELKKDQFEIDFEKLREDMSKIRDLLK